MSPKKLLVLGLGLALVLLMVLVGRQLRLHYRQRAYESDLAKLQDPDPEVRSNAARILRDAVLRDSGEDKLPVVVPALIPLLRDKDATVRKAVFSILSSIGPTEEAWSDEQRVAEALPVLICALKEDDSNSQRGAGLMLSAIGEPAIPALIDALHDEPTAPTKGRYDKASGTEFMRRQAAQAALSEMGKVAVPALIEALKEGGDLQGMAVGALRNIGSAAAEPLVEALQNSTDSETRAGAAAALGHVGQGVEGVVPPLMAMLKDDNPKVQSAARHALVFLGKDAGPALLNVLENDTELRSQAASILHDSLPRTQVIPAIVDLLQNHEDPTVRIQAANVLIQHYYGEKEIPGLVTQGVPALIEALQDKDPRVRRRAAMALGTIQHDVSETVPALVVVLKNDASYWVRSSAAGALGSIGADARATVALLIESMQTDPQPAVRNQAAQAIGKIGPEAGEAVAPLSNALQNDEDHSVRANAATALGQIRASAEPAISTLENGLNDESTVVRGRCALALWNLGLTSESILPGLEHATRDANEPEIREAARKALVKLQDAAKPAAHAKDDGSS